MSTTPEPIDEQTTRATDRMVVIGLTALAVILATYFVPGLAEVRPWIPQEEDGLPADPPPFAMWWGNVEAATKLPNPSFAGYGTSESPGVTANPKTSRMEEPTDDFEAPPQLPPAAPTPTVSTPKVETPTVAEKTPTKDKPAADSKPTEVLKKPGKPPIVIDPKEYEGLNVTIEIPNGKAMDHFYKKLSRTRRREKNAVTRISHWGASVLGADGPTSVARLKLQAQFGYGGRGWINVARGWRHYFQKNVRFRPHGWKSKTVSQGQLRKGLYGYGGAAGLGYAGAQTSYEVYSNIFELYYRANPKGGKVSVRVDGGKAVIISTRSDPAKDAFYRVTAEDEKQKHKFVVRARGGGIVHMYGATMEVSGPGIVYDCITMIGTRSNRLLNFNEEHIKNQVAHRRPDLMIFNFGGNEVIDKGSLKRYKEQYRKVVQWHRAGRPEASCLFMTPTDHRELYRGRPITSRRLKKMIAIQRELAEEEGCAFFNVWKAMGGDGSIVRWRRMRPPRVSGDYVHMTRAGSKALGALVYQGIMRGFAEWLAKKQN